MSEPGWYPDPLGGQGARYWDGTTWEGALQPGQMDVQEFPEPPPEKPRRLWPVWVGLGVSVAIAVGSALFVVTRSTEPTPTAAPSATPTTTVAIPTMSPAETAAASVKISMQRKFDTDPDFEDLQHLTVIDVVLIHKAGNEFKGIATVETPDGVAHDVPIDVTADGGDVIWESGPGAFLFALPPSPEPEPPPLAPAPAPAAPDVENFSLCPSGLSGVASDDTSCAFADSVRMSWYANPGPAVAAFSPITGKSYLMRCLPAVTDVWPEAKRCEGTNAQGVVLVVYID